MSYVPNPPNNLFGFVFIPDFNPFFFAPADRKRKRPALGWTSGGFVGFAVVGRFQKGSSDVRSGIRAQKFVWPRAERIAEIRETESGASFVTAVTIFCLTLPKETYILI